MVCLFSHRTFESTGKIRVGENGNSVPSPVLVKSAGCQDDYAWNLEQEPKCALFQGVYVCVCVCVSVGEVDKIIVV